VPNLPFSQPEHHKAKLGLGDNKIITSFGLMGPGKGYEFAIGAMKEVIRKVPNAQLLLLGETHPVLKQHEGEKYRESLEELVKKHHLENNVQFINRYMTKEEIISYLKATDVYVTPYISLNQITSGTLAYALGAGRACISTPYLYAQEVLGGERGVLVPPQDSGPLAEAIVSLLKDDKVRRKMMRSAYAFGRGMIWPSVALQYLNLFAIVLAKHDR
jgi:glycosyltransferase involved in cell wall biosynthesis